MGQHNRTPALTIGGMNSERSQLPDWMRDPTRGRSTLRWRIAQWVTNLRGWRAVADAWGRWRSRNRFAQRYPKTAEVLAVLLSFAIAVYAAYWAIRIGAYYARL